MALSKTLTETKQHFDGALQIADAYWKVEQVIVSKTHGIAVVSVSKNVDGMKHQLASQQFTFTPNLNGSNFIAQAYDHLKTMPEFAGATDC
jgi:hypothetical protein